MGSTKQEKYSQPARE